MKQKAIILIAVLVLLFNLIGCVASAPSAPIKTAFAGDKVFLKANGNNVLCATTKENLDLLTDCRIADDKVGFNELCKDGRIFIVPTGTAVIILTGRALGCIETRITEGDYKDKIAWLYIESIN